MLNVDKVLFCIAQSMEWCSHLLIAVSLAELKNPESAGVDHGDQLMAPYRNRYCAGNISHSVCVCVCVCVHVPVRDVALAW